MYRIVYAAARDGHVIFAHALDKVLWSEAAMSRLALVKSCKMTKPGCVKVVLMKLHIRVE